MSPAERSRKLREIAHLDTAQIEGWRGMLPLMEGRPFPGEAEALDRREQQLTDGGRP